MTIDGHRWRIVYGDPGRSRLGVCDFEAREITVRRGLTPEETIGTAVHECLHAAVPDLTEDAISRAELAVMQGLRELRLLPAEDA